VDGPGFKPGVDDEVTYRDAGVDIDRADAWVDRIGEMARRTHGPGVLGGLGGFAAVFSLRDGVPDFASMRDPLLVSGTDGVGTKLKVAFAAGRHRTVGIDLVAMCVNDLLTTGATPLFFLDYYGTGRLEPEVATEVVAGIAEGCRRAQCALTGGETAELPGMYAAGEYDLAGFAVGIVDRPELLDGSNCRAGDVLIGVESSGLHSNGYSLARRILVGAGDVDWEATDADLGGSLADVLLEPTLIYTALARGLRSAGAKCHAHITGGGLPGNVPRVLPAGLGARVDWGSWSMPTVFETLARRGPVAWPEMARTFNLGVGWVSVVEPAAAAAALRAAEAVGRRAWTIGALEAGSGLRFQGGPP
jgi:phosphoribosylformylglycinamidine cyclo-ligase